MILSNMLRTKAFDVASVLLIFQHHINTVLQGMKPASAYIDEILVRLEEHIQNLEEVLKRLESAALRLNRDKCSFLRPRIEYLTL